MAKVPLSGLPQLHNPYLKENNNKQEETTILPKVHEKDKDNISVKETEFVIPKIEIPKKVKMTNFSYYGKLDNINKIKKLAKHYKVSPSTLIDSILEAYFNNDNSNE